MHGERALNLADVTLSKSTMYPVREVFLMAKIGQHLRLLMVFLLEVLITLLLIRMAINGWPVVFLEWFILTVQLSRYLILPLD